MDNDEEWVHVESGSDLVVVTRTPRAGRAGGLPTPCTVGDFMLRAAKLGSRSWLAVTWLLLRATVGHDSGLAARRHASAIGLPSPPHRRMTSRCVSPLRGQRWGSISPRNSRRRWPPRAHRVVGVGPVIGSWVPSIGVTADLSDGGPTMLHPCFGCSSGVARGAAAELVLSHAELGFPQGGCRPGSCGDGPNGLGGCG